MTTLGTERLELLLKIAKDKQLSKKTRKAAEKALREEMEFAPVRSILGEGSIHPMDLEAALAMGIELGPITAIGPEGVIRAQGTDLMDLVQQYDDESDESCEEAEESYGKKSKGKYKEVK